MNIQFYPVSQNTCNVLVNGQESNWYVQKQNNWYEILWGTQADLLSFRKQSWFSSQSKSEIKEKLEQSVGHPVEIMENDRGVQYVYQRSV